MILKNTFRLLTVLIPLVGFSQHTPRLWEFTVSVQDEAKKPIEQVKCYVSYYDKKGGKWSKKRIDGETDIKGRFTFKKKALHMLHVSLVKEGYFSAGISPELPDLYIADNLWLPENTSFEVQMVKKEGMRPLIVKQMDQVGPKTLLPKENISIGYDLMQGDWVEPWGSGETPDLFFNARKVFNKERTNSRAVFYEVTTNGLENGLIQVKKQKGFVRNASRLKLGKTAPAEGYQNKFEFVQATGIGEEKLKDDPRDTAWDGKRLIDQAEGYWLRIRSKRDPDTGELISAHYGKIVSPIIVYLNREGKFVVRFDYQISPDPNNRSVVWDRETTLIPGYKLPSWGARYY